MKFEKFWNISGGQILFFFLFFLFFLFYLKEYEKISLRNLDDMKSLSSDSDMNFTFIFLNFNILIAITKQSLNDA